MEHIPHGFLSTFLIGCLLIVQFQVMIPARVAWVVQEMPSFVIPLCYIIQCRSLAGVVLLTVFLLHYFNRTFIYPFQIKSGNGTPWYICLSAIVFCIWNGYIQVCVIVFAAGMFINIQSDAILRNLRNPGETGYKIPRGMFEYVSGANFFGEIVEWSGYAIMSGGSLPAVAFACFTACNIGPRALHHHQWYHSKFPDYPKERKAVIPFIL
ncbi:unnamed protein product [Heligmosomoides polygyrus]|uniref:S5A_REDUCTASE domain-containing protein n=1 Tax=Heligmosomoides polygyrus TaxID=6339 RepID=A0A183FVH0_HELPZ|nr:unnamed protein product [Heligmosomoides polygyrus]